MKELKYIYEIQKKVTSLNGINALLSWDEQTHMPLEAIESRSEQMKIISDSIYEELTSTKLIKSINKLKESKLSQKDKIVLNELDKEVKKIKRVPKDLMLKIIKAQSLAGNKWQIARQKNDWKIFKPYLQELINLKKQEAKHLNPKLKPYDSLMNEFEEGMTSEKVTGLFSYLKIELINLLNEIKSSKIYKKQKDPKLKIPEIVQAKLVEDISKKMKFKGSIDKAPHPFTTRISEKDVRITIRYLNPRESLLAAMHETGHALYELNLPKKYLNTFIYDAPSYGLHESQSRFWENMIGRSKIFWDGYFKHYKKYTTKTEWYNIINQVKPSFIRVKADEVTYCLHIILRFEIERDLINGDLNLDNAQKVWNTKFKEMFGITPKKDNDGILQDVHWAYGSFGYFPSYAIGTIYAAQIFEQIKTEIPNLKNKIKKQEFSEIINWLSIKIHSKGKTMLADDIIKKVTKTGLNPNIYINYLRQKYSKIYQL